MTKAHRRFVFVSLITSFLAAACLLTAFSSSASAAMTLTPAGIDLGFSLTTFADQIPANGSGVGPVGIASFGANSVIVSGYANGTTRIFDDVDGQHYTTTGVAGIATFGGNDAAGLTVLGGNIYMALQSSGKVVQLNNDGSINHTLAGSFPGATGIDANPATNRLYVSNPFGGPTSEVDPVTGLATTTFGGSADGLTLSPDNTILYAEVGSHIIGYNATTYAAVFDSGFISGADGVVIGIGPLAGNIYVNTNFGTIVQVNTTTLVQTPIATGGSRGDLVNLDTFNGTLLLTQTDRVLRLIPPAGGFLPEPGSLLLIVQIGVLLICWRTR